MIDRIIDFLGRSVAWLAFVMVITTFVVVVLRYGFDTSAIMLQELVVYMHGLAFMLGLAYTLKHDGHVRVDLLYSRMRERWRAIVNLAGHVVFLIPLSITIFVFSLPYVRSSWSVLEASPEVAGIPAVFLLKTLVPLAAILLFLETLVLSVTAIQALIKRG
jgi:TRAP-type mannitol/chloroaromatic compound transport system permease small subunit